MPPNSRTNQGHPKGQGLSRNPVRLASVSINRYGGNIVNPELKARGSRLRGTPPNGQSPNLASCNRSFSEFERISLRGTHPIVHGRPILHDHTISPIQIRTLHPRVFETEVIPSQGVHQRRNQATKGITIAVRIVLHCTEETCRPIRSRRVDKA